MFTYEWSIAFYKTDKQGLKKVVFYDFGHSRMTALRMDLINGTVWANSYSTARDLLIAAFTNPAA